MDEKKLNEVEERELTEEESEKVAGGLPSHNRVRKSNSSKRSKGQGDSGGKKSDDGSVSGSGSW